MREMAVDACVLALGMGRSRSPVSAAPLALQQNILAAFHPDQDAGGCRPGGSRGPESSGGILR